MTCILGQRNADLTFGASLLVAPFTPRKIDLGAPRVHDIGCWDEPKYSAHAPTGASLVVHKLKSARWLEYVHSLVAANRSQLQERLCAGRQHYPRLKLQPE